MNKPLFSIITVNLNDKDGLEKTIKSVISQSCKDYEYIIIDGKSTDGSVDVIKKYEKDITYWISEKDKGIYDAMNKGVDIGKGVFIYFLNAGDTFYDGKVLSDLQNFVESNADLDFFYGGINYVNPFNGIDYSEIIMEEINLKKIKKGKMIRHQSLFVKRDVFNSIGKFSLDYGIGGDYDFECRMFISNKKGFFVKRIISNFNGGGAGSDLVKAYRAKSRIIKERFSYLSYLRYFLFRGIIIRIMEILIRFNMVEHILYMRKYFNKSY